MITHQPARAAPPQPACRGPLAPLWDDRLDLWDPRTRRQVGRETDQARAVRHRHAIAICGRCPRRVRCLEGRLADSSTPGGVYGGRVFAERDEVPEPIGESGRPAVAA